MQKKTEEHVFQGMQRDMSISKQKAEFLWDAHNIRLTARHGDTLFSMTNERGTKRIDNVVLNGIVLGYCVLGDYLTVFTTNTESIDKPDYIYKIQKTADGFSAPEVLYNGNLGFHKDNPIETLGVYENVDIQKVYWTDGKNQPRFINITKKLTDLDYNNTSFDFIPTLELKDSIEIRKVADSSGLFPAGVIQYAITYYNKYGQESNVSVVSPLIPTSYTSRAGSPEDTVGNAFKITIKNPDTQFEYLRLYSIFRSSKDTTPICKRVADVKLGEGSGTKQSSNVLYISEDRSTSRYERWSGGYDSSFQLTSGSNFISLGNDESNHPYIGQENVTVDGITFYAERYFHFTKEQHPNLIIKALLYHNGKLDDNPTFITWNTNTTELYLSKGAVSEFDNQPIIWCRGGGKDSDMILASDIHYESASKIDNTVITITDNNTAGEDIDYNELLFVGGEEITAGTLTQKDGTMFLGDITIKRKQLTGSYTVTNGQDNCEHKVSGTGDIKEITDGLTVESSHRICCFPLTMNSSSYKWGNTLDARMDSIDGEHTNIAGFKHGEHYRLGLQFQYKTGKWSQPIFIGDYKQSNRPSVDTKQTYGCRQEIPTFIATLTKEAGQYMDNKDYKRVRPVVCFPTESDQLILCQGILNPTVHSIANRLNHTPDVQSSWFFRPVPAGDEECPQYKHNHTLHSGIPDSSEVGHMFYPTRKDEIQGVPVEFSNIPAPTSTREININVTTDTIPGNQSGDLKYDADDYELKDLTNVFVVDWSYLTFHSPEFEFNDSFYNMDTSTFGTQIVGRYLLTSNTGDIHIITSSSPISTDAPGFYHRIVSSEFSASRINAGLFYRDSAVTWAKNNGEWSYGAMNDPDNEDDEYIGIEVNGNNIAHDVLQFVVYPWHRTGSLNNDCIRPESMPGRTAVLSHKIMTNMMYFEDISQMSTKSYGEAKIKPFNSDQISLVKINNLNYYGNIDQVLSSRFKYPIGVGNGKQFTSGLTFISTKPWNKDYTYGRGLLSSNDPVYMKYKSTPHAVVNLGINPGSDSDSFNNYVIKTGFSVNDRTYPYLYCAEMYREPQNSDFGGTSAMAIHNNLWYPAGPAVQIGCTVDGTATGDGHTEIPYWYGDTYYQRYDCLKTYPFTDEDTNSIIEIGSFMVETRINLDGRYDKSRGDISNFMLNPTVFNLINPVYSQKDNFFNYRILDDDYYALSNYPTMVTWTGYKNNAAEVDSWTNITLASTLEMDGTKGKVNAVRVNSDQLYCFQDDAVGQILFNSRVQISPSDGVPIEISNNYKVDGNRYISTSIGCKNKWSIIEGVDGLYFIDDNTKALYQLGGQSQLKPISTPLNMSYWFMNQDTGTVWRQHYYDGIEIPQHGIRCFYDNANADLYICTPENTLCYSEKLGQFISFLDYHNVMGMFNIDSEYYALNYPDGDSESGVKLWGMFQGQYNTFFDKTYQTDFTFISNENPLNDKIFTNIELRGDFRWWERNMIEDDFNSSSHLVDHRRMFDTVRVWDEYQDTGEINLRFIDDVPSNMKKKFRIWRMDIPRDKDHIRQRIRNTWAKVKFTMNILPATSLQDLCGKTSSEFAVWNSITQEWEDLNFKDHYDTVQGEHHPEYVLRNFEYDAANDVIIESWKYTSGTENITTNVWRYMLKDDMVYRYSYDANPNRSIPYAYRKIHDMEIHDIGVVYYL